LTLLVAVEDAGGEGELIDAARRLAAAAGWDVRAVRVRGPSGEVAPGYLDGEGVAGETGDRWGTLAGVVAATDVACVAVGLRGVDGEVLGATARALLEESAVPVFLVRPGMRPIERLRRLLVPLEGTPSTSGSMLFVEAVLCRPGRDILMVNVATGGTPAEVGSLPAPRFVDQEQYEWSEWQDEFSRRFSQRAEGCHYRVSVLVGDPAATIAEEAGASQAELVVLCWKGTFAEGHGRTVRRLLATSPCPLLVVPTGWTEGPRDVRAPEEEGRPD
jgi:nucleotide-binding universal stress UspA family protein